MKFESKLWLDIDGSGIAGQGRIKLLELIQETGSIKKASETMKMSYKAAWDAINVLNKVYGEPLMERQVGGKGGGGTRLTQAGKDLIRSYRIYSKMNSLYLDELNNANKINAEIVEVSESYMTAKTENGDILSCALLDDELKSGDSTTLLIRPSDIILIDSDSFNTSAKNMFKCKISKIANTDKYSSIVLKTEKGTEFYAQITRSSAENLKLEENKSIFILFKTTSVTHD
jgi:molybdate transport system regulatory protein